MAVLRWKREALILCVGDIVVFALALWTAFFVRYAGIPQWALFVLHATPIFLLLLSWVVVFFIAGLYDKQTNALKRAALSLIVYAQLFNSAFVVFFFYFIPDYGVAPKTSLVLFAIISTVGILWWRLRLFDVLVAPRSEAALVIGESDDLRVLTRELAENPRHHFSPTAVTRFDALPVDEIQRRFPTIIADVRALPALGCLPEHCTTLLASGVRFVDAAELYEQLFHRVSFAAIDAVWFLRFASAPRHLFYDFFKRCMDIIFAALLLVVTLPLYPLIALAIFFNDSSPVFIVQERIGQRGRCIFLTKFRSMRMRVSDDGRWVTQDDDRVTTVGRFLRATRLDELPQLFSVLVGDLSLTGPRPDIVALGRELHAQLPYYAMRNLVQPGLSGWAQIHQPFSPQSLAETRERLAYDFYYLKHRSLLLDLEIALRTIKTLLSRRVN